ncbi:MAG: hypothetical protein ACYTGH_01465 [Planctomycetota bacterium]|jgi:hypothetical protein
MTTSSQSLHDGFGRTRADFITDLWKAIYLVRRKIPRSPDAALELQGICTLFADLHDCMNAWALILDPRGTVMASYKAGTPKHFCDLSDDASPSLNKCCSMQAFLAEKEGTSALLCRNCRFAKEYPSSVMVSYRLDYMNRLIGLLMLEVSADHWRDQEIGNLIEGLCFDLAKALYYSRLRKHGTT